MKQLCLCTSTALLALAVAGSSGCANLVSPNAGEKATGESGNEHLISVARLAQKQGDLKKAKDIYEDVAQRSPQAPEAYHGLGIIAARRGQFDEAERQFKLAYAIRPDDVELLNDIGYAFYLQNRFQEAEKTLRAALEEDPRNARAMNNLGLVLGQMGRTQDSLETFRQTGDEAAAYSNLAFTQMQRAEFDKAKLSYGRALENDVNLTTATNGLLQIGKRQKDRGDSSEMPEDYYNLPRRPLPPQIESIGHARLVKPPADLVASIGQVSHETPAGGSPNPAAVNAVHQQPAAGNSAQPAIVGRHAVYAQPVQTSGHAPPAGQTIRPMSYQAPADGQPMPAGAGVPNQFPAQAAAGAQSIRPMGIHPQQGAAAGQPPFGQPNGQMMPQRPGFGQPGNMPPNQNPQQGPGQPQAQMYPGGPNQTMMPTDSLDVWIPPIPQVVMPVAGGHQNMTAQPAAPQFRPASRY